jgi:hypothetical protein
MTTTDRTNESGYKYIQARAAKDGRVDPLLREIRSARGFGDSVRERTARATLDELICSWLDASTPMYTPADVTAAAEAVRS